MKEKKKNKERNGVCLSTYHSAKGLEWKVVFLINVDQGNAPYKRAISIEDIEEERRLFYVAVTRAENCLNIFYTEENGKSNYIYEMGLN